MDLVTGQVAENRRKLKMTVLYREGGLWYRSEVNLLVDGLKTEVSTFHEHPEYLVLYGHHTKENTLRALGGGQAYTATQIVGTNNEQLPFVPGFA